MLWNKRFATVWAVWLLGAVCISACDSGECKPCGEGDPCPDLTGEYYGSVGSLSDTCDSYDLLVGDFSMRVLTQTLDENGDTSLQAEVKDLRGVWSTMNGWLCNAEESDFPKSYPFMLNTTNTDSNGTQSIYNISGSFTVEGEGDAANPSYIGSLTIRIIDSDGNACLLTGSLNGDLTL